MLIMTKTLNYSVLGHVTVDVETDIWEIPRQYKPVIKNSLAILIQMLQKMYIGIPYLHKTMFFPLKTHILWKISSTGTANFGSE